MLEYQRFGDDVMLQSSGNEDHAKSDLATVPLPKDEENFSDVNLDVPVNSFTEPEPEPESEGGILGIRAILGGWGV